MRTARAGDLQQDVCAAKSASTFAWTCVSRSFVERRTSGLQHYLTSDVSTKAICSTARLPYITIWVEQARSRWERSERYRDGVRGDLTFFLAHTVSALLVHARNRSRRISFGRGAGGSALPARRSHDKIRFFLPHTRRAASKAGWMNPGVCHRTARLCPREGMSQLHVLYGLEGGISNHSHDDALLRPRQRRCTASCERRQGRLQRQAMPFEAFAPTDTQVTQHKQPTPIVHVAVLPDRRHNRDQAAMLACTFHLLVPPVQRPQIKMPACRADCVHVAEGRPCA